MKTIILALALVLASGSFVTTAIACNNGCDRDCSSGSCN